MKLNLKAIDIASYFINKDVSPLKLQKLLYYSQLWFYVKNGEFLFEEKIRAWIYGPVVYEVWDKFRYMKRSDLIPKNRANNTGTNAITPHLDEVWDAYGHLSGSQLVDLSHAELPWKNSRKGLLINQPSDNEVMINVYTIIDFSLDKFNKVPIIESVKSLGHYSNI